MMLRDVRLRLNLGHYVTKKSNDRFPDGESELLFQQFLDHPGEVTRHEYPLNDDELLDKSQEAGRPDRD